MSDRTATSTPPLPHCWLRAGPERQLCCWGAPGADRHLMVAIWLWRTGTDHTVELDAGERRRLSDATEVRSLADAPADARARLARQIGPRRLAAESERWALWTLPVGVLEEVLERALSRQARQGRLPSPVVR